MKTIKVFDLLLTVMFTAWFAVSSEGTNLYPVNPDQPITIEIGYLLPLTGSMSTTGATVKYTLEVAKADFQREFPSATIQETIADTASDPATALTQMKNLAAKGIKFFIGPYSSEEVLSVKPFADANNLVLLSPSATAPSLAADDSIFRLSPDDSKQSLALATLIRKRNVTAIIPIVRNDLYGKEFLKNFIPNFLKLGKIVSSPIYYDPSAQDFTSVINQAISAANSIRQLDAKASIGVLAISFDEIADIFKKASQSNDIILSSVPWFGTDSTAQSTAIFNNAAAAAFAEKTQFTASVVTAYNVASHPFLPFSPIEENLITKVLQKYPNPAKSDICPAYDALWLAGMAKFNTGASYKEELKRISKQVVGFMGASDFNQNGDREFGFYAFYRFMNSKWVLNAAYRFSKYGMTQPFTDFTFDIPQQDKIIKIGILLPSTGSYATSGQSMLKTLQKAKQDIETVIKRYYSAGSAVEYVIEDTKTDPETAYQKLVSMKNSGIELVIGPATSAEAERIAPYADQNGIILVSPSSTSMALAQKDSLFRLVLNDAKNCRALAKVIKDQGIRYTEIIYRNDTYGKGFNEYFRQAFKGTGSICGEGISYDPAISNFYNVISRAEASITKAKALFGAGKTAVLVVSYDEVIPLFESIDSNSVLSEVRWFGTDGIAQSSLLLNSPRATDFAVKTKLTTASLGKETDALVIYSDVMFNDLSDGLGSEVLAFDVAAYDAAWFYTQFSIYNDWYPQANAAAWVNSIFTLSPKIPGYLTTNYLDENGDHTMGSIVFHQFITKNNVPQWKKYASLIYFLTENGPFYEDENFSSNVMLAPELR